MSHGLHLQAPPAAPGSNEPRPPSHGLRARQLDFAGALLDPARSLPPGLVDPDGDPSARRFAVYRNNVIVSLTEALSAAFPVVRRLVGDAFFAAMARIFAAREPPRSPVMLAYGERFADFIATFEPAAGLAYLPDVARLERAWGEAYHAAEADPLDPAALAGLPGECLPQISFILHPALRVVRSPYPMLTIWRMNVDGGVPAPVDIGAGGEDALIVRPAAEVEVRLLPSGAAAFIAALAAGLPVLESTARALADDPRFELGGTLAGLIEAGALTRWIGAGDTATTMPGGNR